MFHKLWNVLTTRWHHNPISWKNAVIGLCAALVLGILNLLGLFELGDAYFYQLTMRISQQFFPAKESSPIVIAEITQNTINKLGNWPVSRTYLARAISHITRDGAKVIAINLDLATARPSEDNDLTRALNSAAPTVLASLAVYPEMWERSKGKQNTPLQIYMPARWRETNSLRFGMANVTASAFGVKKMPLFLSQNNKCIPSFALQTAMLAKDNASCSPNITSSWGGWNIAHFSDLKPIPLDASGKYWINYAKPRDAFIWLPFEELLAKNKSHKNILKDKIVLIGTTAPMNQDLHLTPIGGLYGVEIQALILRSLLLSKHIYPLGALPYMGLLLILGTILGITLGKRHWHEDLPITLFTFILASIAVVSCLILTNVVIPLSAASLTIFITYLGVSLNKNAAAQHLLAAQTKETAHLEALWNWPDKKINLSFLSKRTLETIEEWLGASMGGILIFNTDGKCLQMMDTFGIPDTWQRSRTPGQEGFSEWVFWNKAPLLIPSTRHDQRASGFERAQMLASFAAAPLSVEDNIYGVLWIGSEIPYSLDESVLPKLEQAARPLALGMEHHLASLRERRLYNGALQALKRSQNFYVGQNNCENKSTNNSPQVERIAHYAFLIAKRLGVSKKYIETIKFAALSLDIAGIGSFESLARKSGGITPTDWHKIMPVFKAGLKMLEPLGEIHDLISIMGHIFERYDGKGYPDKLGGENIPIGSRILAIANTFERVSRERISAHGVESALRVINACTGQLFDPELVRIFTGIMTSDYQEEPSLVS